MKQLSPEEELERFNHDVNRVTNKLLRGKSISCRKLYFGTYDNEVWGDAVYVTKSTIRNIIPLKLRIHPVLVNAATFKTAYGGSAWRKQFVRSVVQGAFLGLYGDRLCNVILPQPPQRVNPVNGFASSTNQIAD